MSFENPQVRKTETEVWTEEVEFGRSLEVVWASGKEYAVDDVVRPTRPNGFEYKCTTPGQSSRREPVWKKELAATVKDGSVVWTAQAVSTAGRDTIASVNIEVPTGISTANEAYVGSIVTFDISGGTYDVDADPYELGVEATTDAGEVIEEKIFVQITGV